MAAEIQAIVVDVGSSLTKAGFAGDDAPRAVIPSVVARPKYSAKMVVHGVKDFLVGDEAASRFAHSVKWTMERGTVADYDDFERLLFHTFYNELRIAPEEHPFLFPTYLFTPIAIEQKICQIMFETLGCPAMAGVLSGVCNVLASGRCSALSVDVGAGVTQILPIYESAIIGEAAIRAEMGSFDIRDQLTRQLAALGVDQRTHHLQSSASKLQVDSILKTHCRFARNFDEELSDLQFSSRRWIDTHLTDGTPITLTSQQISATECLFKPSMMGKEVNGIHHLVWESIMRCPMDIRRDLMSNIVISGGLTNCPGFPERLEESVKSLAPETMKIRVCAGSGRESNAWVGGSICGSLSTFQTRWMTKEEYDEYGPMFFHKRGCLSMSKRDQNRVSQH